MADRDSPFLPGVLFAKYPHLRLALLRNVVRVEQLEEAVHVCDAAAKAGLTKTLDEVLLKKGYVTLGQLEDLKKEVAQPTVETVAKRLGDFELLSCIGEGMMGRVYRARYIPKDRLVALKVLTPDLSKDKNLLDRFLHEARAMLQLEHPHIVACYDVGCAKGLYYISMELVDGESLDRRLKRDYKLAERDALTLCRHIALALDHAHQRGILHRDVKPENVLVGRDGLAKLADLGLARAIAIETGLRLTANGATVGSPSYISPEQAQGLDDLGLGTDLYSLGVMLFECVTGQVPYDNEQFYVVMYKHVNDPVRDPRELNPAVSKPVADMCMKLMQKDPVARYTSGALLAADMQNILRSGEMPRSMQAANGHPPPPLKPKPITKRNNPFRF